MNAFEKYNKEQNKEITKMLAKAKHVFAWAMISGHEGLYLETKKGSVRQGLLDNPNWFDVNNFDLRTDGNLYIN
jgi:hypothetical protein